eukprot:2823037-Rhodomonas_salina.1
MSSGCSVGSRILPAPRLSSLACLNRQLCSRLLQRVPTICSLANLLPDSVLQSCVVAGVRVSWANGGKQWAPSHNSEIMRRSEPGNGFDWPGKIELFRLWLF